MLNSFDFYEQELNLQLKKYNKLVEGGCIPQSIFCYQSIIFPISLKYREALWEEQILNKSGIIYLKDINKTCAVYLSHSRFIEIIVNTKYLP